MIGSSPALRQVRNVVRKVARTNANILITGENGSGKEMIAREIHQQSTRKDELLVHIDLGALSETLFESELFGHVKGAFTGALRDRRGRFEEADKGTIFLDEVGEISPYIQVKLLRVLQEKEIERVGDSRRKKVDIRIIAATNTDLYSLVQEGRVRQDLYYRLKVFPIDIPPLRNRKEDIPLLMKHFIKEQNAKTGKHVTGLTESAMRLVMDHAWPGNVRELENAIEHAFVLCNQDHIDVDDLPLEMRMIKYEPDDTGKRHSLKGKSFLRKKLTREKLLEILHECGWNKAEVGRRVGLSRTAIWKYMKKWDIPLKMPENGPDETP